MPPRDALYPLADYFVGAPQSAYAGPDPFQRGQRVEGDIWSTTGTLANVTIRGRAQIQTHGAIYSGQTAYNSGTGFWLEANNGVPRFSIGNSLGDNMTWNGSALAITGAMTATSGNIGGWTVNTNNLAGGTATLHSSGYLNLGSGNNIARVDSTDATYRFWVGNATAASAPFSVDKTGALFSTSGSIAGWTINTTALQLGSAGTTRGVSSGSTAFFAGGSTPSSAPFHVSTAGAVAASNLTVTGGSITADTIDTGTLNFGSSGTVNTTGTVSGTFGGLNIANLTITGTLTLSGGKIIDADGSTWDQNGITLLSSGSYGDTIKWKLSGTDKCSIYATTNFGNYEFSGGGRCLVYNDGATITDAAGNNYWQADSASLNARAISSDVRIILGDSAGTYQFKLLDSGISQVFGINSNGDWVRPIANDSTALGAYFGRIPIFINGSLKYIPCYS